MYTIKRLDYAAMEHFNCNRKQALPGLLHDLSSFVVAGYGLRVAKSILCETGNNIFLSFSHHTD